MKTVYKNYTIEIKKKQSSDNSKEKKLGIMVCGIYNGKQIGEINQYNSYKKFDINKIKQKVAKEEDIAIIMDLFVKTQNDLPFIDFNMKNERIGFIYTTNEKIKEKFKIKNICDIAIFHAEEELTNEIKKHNHFIGHYNYCCVVYKEGERRLTKFDSFSENEAIEYTKLLIDNGGHIDNND